MTLKKIKVQSLFIILLMIISFQSKAQYKSFKISVKGDTINVVDNNGAKQGPWVVHVDPLRGEPGYEEEGFFVDGKKDGSWRKYTLTGDFIALENFRSGDKDGKSEYYNAYGNLLRQENWRAYNPNAPYDTIPIYGKDNNEIISYKVVKAVPYSVKDGDWTYYDPTTGMILKTEKYDRGHLLQNKSPEFVSEDPMKKIKPKEVIEYEKKNSGKKKVRVREGQTSN